MKRLKTDSDAFRMLVRLVQLGGVAQFTQFDDVGTEPFRYRLHVLSNHLLIDVDSCKMTATQRGKDYVAEHAEMTSAIVTHVAEVQVAEQQLNRPYASIRSTTNPRPYRPGSEDYKNVPSLHTANVTIEKTVNEHGNPITKVLIGSVIRKLPSGRVV